MKESGSSLTPGAVARASRAAKALIRQRGKRLTPARVQVLGVLLATHTPLTHHEVEEVLNGQERVDRVTVYRVLEWLVGQGFAHRIVGDDRVWRYKAQLGSSGHEHAHFKCNRCGVVYCLENTSMAYALALPPRLPLPGGGAHHPGAMRRLRRRSMRPAAPAVNETGCAGG